MFKTPNRSNPNHTDLQFDLETLEERQMLAGNVFAFVDLGGTLMIQGDEASNRVAIVSDGTNLTISGQGTSINGDSDPLVIETNSVNSLFGSLGDGNDRISFETNGSTATQFELFQILTGGGNDQVNIQANNDGSSGLLTQVFSIQTNEGNDRVTIGSNIQGSAASNPDETIGIAAEFFNLNTSDGNDRITLTAGNTNNSTGFSANGLNLFSGGGNDRILLSAENDGQTSGFTFDEQLIISTDAGRDRVDLVAENSGNSVGFESSAEFSGTSIFTGADDDRVSITANNDGGDGFLFKGTLVDTGDGRDRMTLRARNSSNGIGFGSRNSTITTGNGDDRVDIRAENRSSGASFDFGVELNVRTSTGEDSVSFNNKNNADFVENPIGFLRVTGEQGERDSLKTNLNLEDEANSFGISDFERVSGQTGLT